MDKHLEQELMNWGARARNELEVIADEAERSSGPNAARDLRVLVAEFDDIRAGGQPWRRQLLRDSGRDNDPSQAARPALSLPTSHRR